MKSPYETTIVDLLELLSVPYPNMDSFREMTPPRTLRRLRKAFDVQRVFEVLTHLQMEDGHVLDYVYRALPGFDGSPMLYARARSARPAESVDNLDRQPAHDREFPFRVGVRNSRQGFFELALLRILGQQFFLFWHSRYMSVRPVCGEATLSRIAEIIPAGRVPTEAQLARLRRTRLEPTIELKSDTAVVGMVLFSPWGGFSYVETTFNLRSPHLVVGESTQLLVKFQCEVTF